MFKTKIAISLRNRSILGAVATARMPLTIARIACPVCSSSCGGFLGNGQNAAYSRTNPALFAFICAEDFLCNGQNAAYYGTNPALFAPYSSSFVQRILFQCALFRHRGIILPVPYFSYDLVRVK